MMWTDNPERDAERYQDYLMNLEEYEVKTLHCIVDDDVDWQADARGGDDGYTL